MHYHCTGTAKWRQTDARHPRARRRRPWSYTPQLGWLEGRTLLAGDRVSDPAPLAFDTRVEGSLAPFAATFYEVSSDVGGKLTVSLQAPGFAARVSLVDATGEPLVQTDGSATGANDGLIDIDVPAGPDFLEVQSLGGKGSYQLSADFTATLPPFQNLPALFNGATPIAVVDVDVNGAAIPALITPEGVRLSVGDGTFESSYVDGPLGDAGYSVTAITVAGSNAEPFPNFAILETASTGGAANVLVYQNVGDGVFKVVQTVPVDPDATALQAVDFGNGIIDLAVTDYYTGQMAMLVGNGGAGYSALPSINVGSAPVAMVSGQFGDGHLDLIVADQGDSTSGIGPELSVLQSDGPKQFQVTSTIPLSAIPSALAVGDFRKGQLDLAIANADANDVTVILGNSDGTFAYASATSYFVGTAPDAIVACALEKNGPLDLVVANDSSNDVSVLLGNGDGTFRPQVRYGAGTSPSAIVTTDLNGDQIPDLLVANLGTSDISVLIGKGDGTFQDQTINPVGNAPDGIVTADLNHDGILDIVTADQDSNDVSVLMGNGDGTFQPAQFFAAGVGPTAVTVGDFNGDGRLDLAVADGAGGPGGVGGVSILLGNGDGTFVEPPVFYPTGFYPSSIVAGDFTGNGILDLAVANFYSGDVSILMGNGDGGFSPAVQIPLGNPGSEPVAMTMDDFGNHQLDLAVVDQSDNGVWILEGNGQGGFQVLPMISLGGDSQPLPEAIVAGNFRGNGLLDLAVLSQTSVGASVTILQEQGACAFSALSPTPLAEEVRPISITAGYFTGDDILDLAIADPGGSGAVWILAGDGQDGFEPLSALDLNASGTPYVVATGDFTGNGELDLAVGLQGPNSVEIELNLGNGQFAQPGLVGLVPRNTPVVADFTGDGVPDVAVVDGAGDILFRQGVVGEPGSFEPPMTINPGIASRDIAAVNTGQGVLLASVDAVGNSVSWFAYHNGQFRLMGTLATGLEPAQIVSADLNGTGDDDLIIRNAGNGTLTIYLSNPLAGGFKPPITLAVGPGISDVSVADLGRDGLPDILLSNQTSGEVDVILNLGDDKFSQPTLYRAGVGLSAVAGGTGTTPLSVCSQDGTLDVAAATLTAGGPPDLVALNSGAETLGILTGLGDGRFANPVSSLTTGPTLAVRVADFTGNGIDDLAILGPDSLTIWLGNGHGGFVQGATYSDVGPDPTGLTIADLYGDKVPDILVGNAFGDVLVLVGKGNGLFQPPTLTNQSVALAVTYASGSRTPTFIYSNQASDSVVVRSGSGAPQVLANRTTGLLVPGEAVLADLNGNGLMDLIVLNTGGNDVLVYPGLPGGGFGQELNGGQGFATGTNPVAVIVADLNGRPDLIVANEGSNDVSVLLNVPEGNSFTFEQGPRLRVGQGPVGLLYGDFYGNGADELVVSDSGSKNLMILPSLGGEFFNDADPTIIAMSESPGQIIGGDFGDGSGLDIVALNPGTSDVTLITGLSTGSPTSQIFSSGGLDPVAAFAVNGLDGYDDLVVANNADGRVALLAGGQTGLTLEQVNALPDLLSPTGLALASLQNNNLEVYASTAGDDAVAHLGFSLGALGGSSSTAGGGQALTLLPFGESSLPLIATLLTPSVNLNTTQEEPAGGTEGNAAVVALATATTSLGQGPFWKSVGAGYDGDDGELATDPTAGPTAVSEKAGLSRWRRLEMGLDEAFDEIRRANQTKPRFDDGAAADEENDSPDPTPPAGRRVSARQPGERDQSALFDAAIQSLAATDPFTTPIMAIGRAGCVELAKNRREPGALKSTMLVILQAGLVMVPARAGGSSGIPRRLSGWRMTSVKPTGRNRKTE
jgi:FG-GAP-like repeat